MSNDIEKATVLLTTENFRIVIQKLRYNPWKRTIVEQKDVVNALGEQQWVKVFDYTEGNGYGRAEEHNTSENVIRELIAHIEKTRKTETKKVVV
jgi:hypothetical protein